MTVVDQVSPRVPRALTVARGAVAVALAGTAFSPPLTHVGLFVLLLAFPLIPAARERLLHALRTPLARAALALLGVLAIAMLWSNAPWPHRIDVLADWRTLPLMLLTLAVFDTAASKARLAFALVAVAAAGALLSFGSVAFDRVVLTGWPPGVVFRNSSTQSMVFVVGLTFATVLAAWRGESALSVPLRRVCAVAALLLFANLLFVTYGRSGQVAALIIAGVLGLSLLRGRTRWATLVAVPAVALAVVASSAVIQQRFTLGWNEMQTVEAAPGVTSMGMRVVMWRTTVEVLKDSPWWGYGTGGFDAAYAAKTPHLNSGWRATPTADPHNQYLYVWASAGVPGLLALLAFMLAAVLQRADAPWRQLAVALLAAWSVTSLFSSHFQTFSEGHLIVLLLGVLLAPPMHQRGVNAANTAASTSS